MKFYLGQNEDCSPGDSTSDSSEKQLRALKQWAGHSRRDFGEGRAHMIKHIFFQKVSASLVKLC